MTEERSARLREHAQKLADNIGHYKADFNRTGWHYADIVAMCEASFTELLAEAQATISALSPPQRGTLVPTDKLKEMQEALTVARARITQLSLENEQLNAAQSARETTNREGASQPLRADIQENEK